MRIGEAAAAAGMTTKTLRFYEDSGLLPAAKRSSNGYRDYHDDSVARLEFIRRGRAAGLALPKYAKFLASVTPEKPPAPTSKTFSPTSWPNWTTRFLN